MDLNDEISKLDQKLKAIVEANQGANPTGSRLENWQFEKVLKQRLAVRRNYWEYQKSREHENIWPCLETSEGEIENKVCKEHSKWRCLEQMCRLTVQLVPINLKPSIPQDQSSG